MPIQNRLNDCISDSGFIHRRANFFRRGRLFESQSNHGAAFEVDAEIERFSTVWMESMTIKPGAHPGQQQQDGKADEEPALAEPIDVYVLEYLNHLNAKRLDAFSFASKQPDKNRPRNVNCREQIDEQTQHQGDRK